MRILLEKRVGLKGIDVTKSWTASVVNANREVVVIESSITANGALREIEMKLQEALRAVQEMKQKETRS